MNSLFSHGGAGTPAETPSAPPPVIVAEVIVPHTAADAFTGFTDAIHLWWPSDQTIFGDGTHPEFTDGELFEEDPTGKSALWATVVPSQSEAQLELAWHLSGNPNASSRVTASFSVHGSETTVTVIHDGWAAGAAGHEQYEAAPDWQAVLDRYRRFMGGAA